MSFSKVVMELVRLSITDFIWKAELKSVSQFPIANWAFSNFYSILVTSILVNISFPE